MKIKAVLSPDHWSVVLVELASTSHPESFAAEQSPVERALVMLRYRETRTLQHAIRMALENAALPNDSPYKITQGDVDFLEWLAEQVRQLNPISVDDETTLLRLTSKLESLLPPELLAAQRRSPEHAIKWQKDESARLDTCDGHEIEPACYFYAGEQKACPRCGKMLRLVWNVYVEELI